MLKQIYGDFVQRLIHEIQSYYKENLVSIVLFGSVARGVFRNDSDIDVLIVCEVLPRGATKRMEEFLLIEDRLENELRDLRKKEVWIQISPVLKTKEEVLLGSPLFLDFVFDAKILYDKENFFNHYISQFKRKLEQSGAKRIQKDMHWYWILDPKLDL
ncbi:MAG: nucleotidyltransferase domain-containing protein [Leptospiraceae bacterium]|nr:nucleotidyltransferase domain-containing protein [Leptospiraceae bacterium]MDW7976812.1 nucleotidyltransferase domain-containing protein [Leptospiraceae bacterium]